MPCVSSALPTTEPSAGKRRRSRVIEASPVYYGWVILAAAAVGTAMTAPGQTFGVSAFLDAILRELDLKRSTVSLMYSLGTLAGSLVMPRVGRWIDEVGPRKAVTFIAAIFALGCFGMSRVNGPAALFLGFTVLRGVGQGALSIVTLHVVNLWFVRRRGMAVGISGLAFAASSALFPLGIAWLIERHGWRDTYSLLGLAIALTILPIGALFFRDAPEHFGLLPDGQTASPDADLPSEHPWTLEQARRTPMFWLLAAGNVLPAALLTGLVFHHFSIMGMNGLTRVQAATMFVPMAAVTALSNLTTGVLLDRLRPERVLAVGMLLLGVTVLYAPHAASPQAVWVYGGLMGLQMGMQTAVAGTVWSHFFGRAHQGAIRGFTFTLMVAGSAFGPLPFAWCFEAFGSYSPLLYASAALPAAVALWALAVPQPRHPDSP